MIAREAGRDLLGGPALGEQTLHLRPQRRVAGELLHLGPSGSLQGPLLLGHGPVGAASAAGCHLTRDRGCGPPQILGDSPQGLPCPQTPRDLLSLSVREPQRRPRAVPVRHATTPVAVL